nr:hypothetical protein [Nocardia jejuensis]
MVEPAEDSTLLACVYPPDDHTYATVLAGAEVLCDQRFMLDRPSQLAEHLRKAGTGRRIIMHAMHSVVDWLAFAVWEDGTLIRSLSVSPEDGIVENIGDPFDFELPYWAGKHPVEPVPGWPDQSPYPLPFHPLELGEHALRCLFGFVVEGYDDPADVRAEDIRAHGFLVTDPTGEEHSAQEALYAKAEQTLGLPQVFRIGPDGFTQASLGDF